MKNIVVGIYGASKCGLNAKNTILKVLKKEKIKLCFFDSDEIKIKKSNNLEIKLPTIENLCSIDYLLICSVYEIEIFSSVFLKIDLSKIFFSVNNLLNFIISKHNFKANCIVDCSINIKDNSINPNAPLICNTSTYYTTAFTICSTNHISYALTAANTFLDVHVKSIFYIFITDKSELFSKIDYDTNKNIKIIFIEDLFFEDYDKYCFKYNKYELCTSLRPKVISYLFKLENTDQLIMVDPDLLTLSPFHKLLKQSKKHSILIFPHQVSTDINNINPHELSILKSGIFNCGLMILNKNKETHSFLDWWEKRLSNHCLDDLHNGLFVDQLWINFIPTLFPNCKIIREKEYNVAYWNLNERKLSLKNNKLYIESKEVNSFHFSGMSYYWNNARIKLQEKSFVNHSNKAIDYLLKHYIHLLKNNYFNETIESKSKYDLFHNGVKISPIFRKIFYENQNLFSNTSPFEINSNNCFYNWLNQPSNCVNYITNLSFSIMKLIVASNKYIKFDSLIHNKQLMIYMILKNFDEMEIDRKFFKILA